MSEITIRRCPVNPHIIAHAHEINLDLMMDLGREARIEEGVENEFTVLVDDMPMLQRSDASLPSADEVEAAIQNGEGDRVCLKHG